MAKASKHKTRSAEEHLADQVKETSADVREAFNACRLRMEGCVVTGSDRAVFLGPTDQDQSNRTWAKQLGQRLGLRKMHELGDLLTEYSKCSRHANRREFALDLRDLDLAWNGVHGWLA
jgi:hypothetical protein